MRATIAGHEFRTPELLISGAGVVMLVNSVLPWYGYDARGWHPTYVEFQSGFRAFLPLLIVVLIAGTTAVCTWTGTELPQIGSGRVSWKQLFLVGDLLAALLVVFFWAMIPPLYGVSSGAKIGTFIGLIVALVQGAAVLLAMAAVGERLPARMRRTPIS